MSVSIALHTKGNVHASQFMPDNNNSITLTMDGDDITLFGLSDHDAATLFEMFRGPASTLVIGSRRYSGSDTAFHDKLDAMRAKAARAVLGKAVA